MRYINMYTGEKFEDPEDCFESIIEYQAEGVARLGTAVAEYIHSVGGDKQLFAAWDYLRDASAYLDGGIDMDDDDAEDLIWAHMATVRGE